MTDLARLRQLVTTTEVASDADLLDRFITDRDGPAFAALVRRHGPMVLAVCRRVLRHRQDAEDAFQATFLVLARRAETVKPRSLLGNWLYGVAYRTALGARRAATARRAWETRVATMRTAEAAPAPDEGHAAELREVLDRELAALPDVYRAALVACGLEGLDRRDAAVRLGWTEGTLSSRLARARALLARRLARYGLAIPAAGLATVAGPEVVANTLAEPTVRLATLVATGEAMVAAPVAALMEQTMRTMLLLKFKSLAAAAVVGCAVVVTALAGWRADAAGNSDPAQPEAPKAVEAPKRAAPNSDKERIAELEQERDRLLKQVADLAARLEKLETEQLEHLQEAKQRYAAKMAEAAAQLKAQGSNLLPPAAGGPNGPNTNQPVPPKTAPITPGQSLAPPSNFLAPAGEPSRPGEKGQPGLPTVPGAAPTLKAVVKTYDVASLVGDEKEGEALVKVVRAVVEPKSWGADTGAEYLSSHKLLVVRQTDKVHEEVKELLDKLGSRKKPAQNPAVRP